MAACMKLCIISSLHMETFCAYSLKSKITSPLQFDFPYSKRTKTRFSLLCKLSSGLLKPQSRLFTSFFSLKGSIHLSYQRSLELLAYTRKSLTLSEGLADILAWSLDCYQYFPLSLICAAWCFSTDSASYFKALLKQSLSHASALSLL